MKFQQELVIRRLFLLLTLAVLLALAACSGSSSPTDPGTPLPNVAGSWTGSWGVANFGVRSTMNLSQDAKGNVTGTVGILGANQAIVGTVTATRFSWHLAATGCQTFVGDLDLTMAAGSVTAMAGTATQDNRGCLAGGVVTSGRMSLTHP